MEHSWSKTAGVSSTNSDIAAQSEHHPGGEDVISEAARVQRRLWGTEPQVWAVLGEAHNRPLFEAVLDAAGVGAGTRVLDVGCG